MKSYFGLAVASFAAIYISGCAGSPPSKSGPGGGGGDAVIGDMCSAPAQKQIAAAADENSISLICKYKDSIANTDLNFFDDPASKYEPYFGDTIGEAHTEGNDSNQKLYSFSIYTGVLAKGQKVSDVADVIRLQVFFPTEFKSAGFETDAQAKYTPKNVTGKDFKTLDYQFEKSQVGNESPAMNYDSTVTFFDYGTSGTVVVDKITSERGGGMKSRTGVMLIYQRGSDVVVVGRSQQGVRAQQQSWASAQTNIKSTMLTQVKRDFNNYAKAASAATIMAGKRK